MKLEVESEIERSYNLWAYTGIDTYHKEFHEISNIFPLLQGEEFDALKADIAANGLQEAIWLHPDGRIIDGRNRYLACVEMGIEPTYRTWNGQGSLVTFVVSLNLHRRHLTSSQRAAIAVEVQEKLSEEIEKQKQELAQRSVDLRWTKERIGKEMYNALRPHLGRRMQAHQKNIEARRAAQDVYFIRDGNKVKIGISLDPEARLKELLTGNPDVELMGSVPGGIELENALHKEFASFNVGGEWFHLAPEVQNKIDALIRVVKIDNAYAEKRDAREEAAKVLHTSDGYLHDASVLRKTNPTVFEQVRSGNLNIPEAKKLTKLPEPVQAQVMGKIATGEAKTVKEAHRQIKDEEIAERIANPPPPAIVDDCKIIIGDARKMDIDQFERYRVIVADPPWPYDNPKSHDPRMGGYTYQAMSLDEICAMPISQLAADDCILFLWGTWPKLPQVVWVMQEWGFEHVTGFPWIKTTQDGQPIYGIGHWVAGCSEYVLIGRKGNVAPPDVDNYLGLIGPALEHSRKPDDVHAMAEQLPGPYIELFARRSRPGWTVFGDGIDED